MSRAPSVLIVGAGFGGVAVALELMLHGQDNLTILEKADDLGGVWRDNTYPGAACDAPSDLYSYSFAPNAQWPKRFAEQREILNYIRVVAAEHGVLDRIRFGTEVAGAEFDDVRGVWRGCTTAREEARAAWFRP